MRRALAIVLIVVASACSDPPAIPHTVSDTADTWCRTCHVEGDRGAPVSPHPTRRNCAGCHTPTGTEDVGALGAAG
jgi:hypothetical protein